MSREKNHILLSNFFIIFITMHLKTHYRRILKRIIVAFKNVKISHLELEFNKFIKKSFTISKHRLKKCTVTLNNTNVAITSYSNTFLLTFHHFWTYFTSEKEGKKNQQILNRTPPHPAST